MQRSRGKESYTTERKALTHGKRAVTPVNILLLVFHFESQKGLFCTAILGDRIALPFPSTATLITPPLVILSRHAHQELDSYRDFTFLRHLFIESHR